MDTTTVEAAETEAVAVEGDELEMVEGAGRVEGKEPNPSAGVCKGTVCIQESPGLAKSEGG